MKRVWTAAVCLLVVAGIGMAVVRLAPAYDASIRLQEDVRREWSQVDVLLQRRYELIPNLVQTVKGYAALEPETLTAVAEAHAGWARAKTAEEKMHASYLAERSLHSVALWGQVNPNLEADAHFTALLQQLRETEDLIAQQRMRYNAAVSTLNTSVRSLAGRPVAALAGVEEARYYEPPAPRDMAPAVHFTGPPPGDTFALEEVAVKGTVVAGATSRAVLELPDGKELVVEAGMELPEARARVVSIQAGHVLFEETVYDAQGRPGVRQVRLSP